MRRTAVLLFCLVGIAGCGSNSTPGTSGFLGSAGTQPIAGESTSVTLVASSAANDQLASFQLFLNSLSLTSASGKTVTLIASPLQAEFIHLNGAGEPLLTVSVPQDVYVSATASVGAASFDCEVARSNSISSSIYANGSTPTAQVAVNLPKSLTVDGTSMAVSLQLQVSQSVSFPSQCYVSNGQAQYQIAPTFTLSALGVSSQPTNWTNGKFTGLEGMVSAIGSAGVTISSADGAGNETESGSTVSANAVAWKVTTDNSTVFQGIGNANGLTLGMPVDFDGILQPDGSLVATRLAATDPNTVSRAVISGPVIQVVDSAPLVAALGRQTQGLVTPMLGPQYFSMDQASFSIWGGMSNLSTLPFTATFSANNMVPGQMVSMTSPSTAIPGGAAHLPVSTVTLIPQTINGTVSSATTQGAFTVYTVQLAAYDLFPQFAILPGQISLLSNPGQIVVYADANAASLAMPTPGSVARFTGLIFNDTGTLRMDCSAIGAGVPE